MRTIWKYEFEMAGWFSLSLPAGAHILSLQVQREKPCLWALVDTEKAPEKRWFLLVGTGHEIVKPGKGMYFLYIDTFQLGGGGFVGHLFEAKPEKP